MLADSRSADVFLRSLGRPPVRYLILKWTPVVLVTACALLQIGILVAMNRKKLRRQFPVFFNYNIYTIAAVVISFFPYFLCCSGSGSGPGAGALGFYIYDALSV